jgi:DNA-binding NtrC family response regulator
MSNVTTSTAGGRAGGALIASPSSAFRGQVLESLQGRWWPVQHAGGGAEALEKLAAGQWQILFLDRRLPDLDSEELIATVLRQFPSVEVVRLDSAAEFSEYQLRKDANDLRHGMGKVEYNHQLRQAKSQEESSWEKNPDKNKDKNKNEYEPLPGMIGRSEAMQEVYRLAQLVAPRTTTVLIVGPTGSGKELVARALHILSPRAAKPFVAVNCAAIPEALLESELFGYARGAFTGAVQTQLGRIAGHTGERFFWMKSASCRWPCRPSCCVFWNRKKCSGWARWRRSAWMCG